MPAVLASEATIGSNRYIALVLLIYILIKPPTSSVLRKNVEGDLAKDLSVLAILSP
jgi:hypothetical protein